MSLVSISNRESKAVLSNARLHELFRNSKTTCTPHARIEKLGMFVSVGCFRLARRAPPVLENGILHDHFACSSYVTRAVLAGDLLMLPCAPGCDCFSPWPLASGTVVFPWTESKPIGLNPTRFGSIGTVSPIQRDSNHPFLWEFSCIARPTRRFRRRGRPCRAHPWCSPRRDTTTRSGSGKPQAASATEHSNTPSRCVCEDEMATKCSDQEKWRS